MANLALVPGQSKAVLEHGFGQVGQVVADVHQRQAAERLRRRHLKDVPLLEGAQLIEQRLLITHLGELLAKGFGQRLPIRGQLYRGAVDEQAKEPRPLANLLRQPQAAAGHANQPLGHLRMVAQQRQVS